MKLCIPTILTLLAFSLSSCLSNGLHGPITNNNSAGNFSSGGDGTSYGIFSLGKKKKRRRRYKNKKSKYGYYNKKPKTNVGFFGNSYGSDNDSYYKAPTKKTSYYGSSYNSNYNTKSKKQSNYYKRSNKRKK